MLALAEDIVAAIGLWAWLLYELYEQTWVYSAILAASLWFYTADDLWHHDHLGAGINGFSAVVWTFVAWHDWKNRNSRRRRRAAAWLGEKSRAALQKLQDTLRERELKPVPVQEG